MRVLSRGVLSGLVVTGVLLTTAVPALAEGSFTSTMTNAGQGFRSRVWEDRDLDNQGSIVALNQCVTSDRANSFQLKLMKDNFWGGESRGTITYACAGSTWKQYNWGDQPKGNYYFEVVTVGNGGVARGSANVRVNY